jgi:hypothetical protein
MKKKAQIQMMETISTLFIFFILIVIGLIFYFNLAKTSIQEKTDQFQDLSRVQVAQLASTLPELQCSQENVIKANCFDMMKLDSASKENGIVYTNKNFYFDLMLFSNITVRNIYPEQVKEWNIYFNQPSNFTSRRSAFFPISLYNATDDLYNFGLLIVEVYS